METSYQNPGPAASEVESSRGVTLLEFGTSWCGYCGAAQRPIGETLVDHPEVRHLKIEDGPGRPLGRAYRVKLWPTLVVLRDGKEVARVVRPREADAVREALAQATAPA